MLPERFSMVRFHGVGPARKTDTAFHRGNANGAWYRQLPNVIKMFTSGMENYFSKTYESSPFINLNSTEHPNNNTLDKYGEAGLIPLIPDAAVRTVIFYNMESP